MIIVVFFSYVGSDNPDTFFDGSERSRMVYDLLIRTKYGEDDEEITHRIGISRLLQNGAYTAAYPLHEVRLISVANVVCDLCVLLRLTFRHVKMKLMT